MPGPQSPIPEEIASLDAQALTFRSPASSPETALLLQTHRLRTLNRIAKAVASELHLDRIVQIVTDAATDLSGAQFGAFFYNEVSDQGESYVRYTLSGAPREAFEKFPLPRNTAVFGPTFRGEGVVRSDDIRRDSRYGRNSPYFGMPEGHLPVVSYLAVPVISRSGDVLGGLFFGHEKAGVFGDELEELITAIAAHAAIAIDNSALFERAQREADRQRELYHAAAHFAAIVGSSEDAILSMNLDGIIQSWNRGAENLFGYSAEEVTGQSIAMLIPEGREDEEPTIVDRIRHGEKVEQYETVRRHKTGERLDVSLTVSPIINAAGAIVGVSKIVRDISEKRRAEEGQSLLLREMSHRVKNLFALASGVVTISSRSATSVPEFATSIRERLSALGRAHELTLPDFASASERPREGTSLLSLLQAILAPYTEEQSSRIQVSGPDAFVGASSLVGLALLLHEFSTNAAKYGALSTASGQLRIDLSVESDALRITWCESGGPEVDGPKLEGFGTTLERATVRNQLQGSIEREWLRDGLTIRLSVPLSRLEV
jgi:PAS domain S-box-containing protein